MYDEQSDKTNRNIYFMFIFWLISNIFDLKSLFGEKSFVKLSMFSLHDLLLCIAL